MAVNVGWFELGRDLHEARIREAWNFGKGGNHAERRLAQVPYPRHPADADPHCQSAEVELAQAQAKAIMAKYDVVLK